MVILSRGHANVMQVTISEKLTRDDYELFVPEIERMIAEVGKIRLLVHMENFSGWSAGALWEDVKFDLKHFADIERVALVGERQWQKGMSVFCKPFTTAHVRYFDASEGAQARAWIEAP